MAIAKDMKCYSFLTSSGDESSFTINGTACTPGLRRISSITTLDLAVY